MPATRDAGRVLRPGDADFEAAASSGKNMATKRCEHPGCSAPTAGKRVDSHWCEEHRKSKYFKQRAAQAAGKKPVAPRAAKPAPVAHAPTPKSGNGAAELAAPPFSIGLPAPAAMAPAEPARTPLMRAIGSMPLTTELTIWLLRAAAWELERLHRGEGVST